MKLRLKSTKEGGFSLTEVIISMVILVILAIIAMGAFKPSWLINRGLDARRKKDVARIRAAFEEYSTDNVNGCYPNEELVTQLMDQSNCKSSTVFAPWLAPWPCDPQGGPYKIAVPGDDCPKTFKIMALLADRKDKDIPLHWYTETRFYSVGTPAFTYPKSEVNYGVSSTNTWWYDPWIISDTCDPAYNCWTNEGSSCTQVTLHLGHTCSGNGCFRDPSCSPECQVPSCPWD